jgi:hypothetical protein
MEPGQHSIAFPAGTIEHRGLQIAQNRFIDISEFMLDRAGQLTGKSGLVPEGHGLAKKWQSRCIFLSLHEQFTNAERDLPVLGLRLEGKVQVSKGAIAVAKPFMEFLPVSLKAMATESS